MKKYFALVALMMFLLVSTTNQAFAQKPDYEKYGRIAIAVVAADYPGDEIQEYQYLGRKKVKDSTVSDSFRFQVQEKNEKFYVTVNVIHDLTNNKLLNLTVESQR